MVNTSFDAGVFLVMLVLGFVSMAMAKQRGCVLLIVSVVCFSVIGLLILTGNDISSFTQAYDTSGQSTNQTTYFIGNGVTPTGTGQLWMGYVFITLAIVSGAMFLNALSTGEKIL